MPTQKINYLPKSGKETIIVFLFYFYDFIMKYFLT